MNWKKIGRKRSNKIEIENSGKQGNWKLNLNEDLE